MLQGVFLVLLTRRNLRQLPTLMCRTVLGRRCLSDRINKMASFIESASNKDPPHPPIPINYDRIRTILMQTPDPSTEKTSFLTNIWLNLQSRPTSITNFLDVFRQFLECKGAAEGHLLNPRLYVYTFPLSEMALAVMPNLQNVLRAAPNKHIKLTPNNVVQVHCPVKGNGALPKDAVKLEVARMIWDSMPRPDIFLSQHTALRRRMKKALEEKKVATSSAASGGQLGFGVAVGSSASSSRAKVLTALEPCRAFLHRPDTPNNSTGVKEGSHAKTAPNKAAHPPKLLQWAAREKLLLRQPHLPISEVAADILRSICDHDVTIVAAGTGSGKTTQVPSLILDNLDDNNDNGQNGGSKKVIITQPRRLAAISIARRVAQERKELGVGGQVGYAVRFDTQAPKHPTEKILFCTGGMLTRFLAHADILSSSLSSSTSNNDQRGGGLLSGVTHLVLDEVHERDIDTDIALLVAKQLMRHCGIRLILMSATMDGSKVAEWYARDGFSVGPVISVREAGGLYPITEAYLDDLDIPRNGSLGPDAEDYLKHLLDHSDDSPTKTDKNIPFGIAQDPDDDDAETSANPDPNPNASNNNADRDAMLIDKGVPSIPPALIAHLLAKIVMQERARETGKPNSAHKIKPCVLVFLPGWEDIQAVSKGLLQESHVLRQAAIHCLHSQVTPQQMEEAYGPCPPQAPIKVILATNIAESSVTIPDVTHVIDGARQKSDWSGCGGIGSTSGMRVKQLLPSWASQANMRQRRGRVGRCSPGTYWCLLPRRHVLGLPEHMPPEIMRAPLASTVLSVIALGQGRSGSLLLQDASLSSSRAEQVNNTWNHEDEDNLNFGRVNRKKNQPGSTGLSVADVLGRCLDGPPPQRIHEALEHLEHLGAISSTANHPKGSLAIRERLTPLGSAISRFPDLPHMNRFVLVAGMLGVWAPAASVIACVDERIFLPAKPLSPDLALHAEALQAGLQALSELSQQHTLKPNKPNSPLAADSFNQSDHMITYAFLEKPVLGTAYFPTRVNQGSLNKALRIREQYVKVLQEWALGYSSPTSTPSRTAGLVSAYTPRLGEREGLMPTTTSAMLGGVVGKGQCRDAQRLLARANRNALNGSLVRFLLQWAFFPQMIGHPKSRAKKPMVFCQSALALYYPSDPPPLSEEKNQPTSNTKNSISMVSNDPSSTMADDGDGLACKSIMIPSTSAVRLNAPQEGNIKQLLPRWAAFSQLIDLGKSAFLDTCTAVDPLMFLLISQEDPIVLNRSATTIIQQHEQQQSYNAQPVVVECEVGCYEPLQFVFEDQADLELILEMRTLWKRLLQDNFAYYLQDNTHSNPSPNCDGQKELLRRLELMEQAFLAFLEHFTQIDRQVKWRMK